VTRVGTAASPVGPFVPAGVVPRRRLFERLGRAARVVAVSAPAGSGKTILLRSWIREMRVTSGAAWVSVQHEEHDSQRFWISVLDSLRSTAAGSTLVRGLTAAPDLDGEAIAEQLLEDLAPLENRLWLVIDDLHELRSSETLRQLQLLLMCAPDKLRFVLSSRHHLRLGLHRLRLEAGLTELRGEDLSFSVDEARSLFEAAGVELSGSALASLIDRTEGWAAGLRMAALSLAGQPNAERLAAEFSGGERTVAEYFVAEVLDRQPEEVRRLLVRTSVLERVSGTLADALTPTSRGERILHELEDAGAFVMSLDAQRTWFRYQKLFADFLKLELRRTAPEEVAPLHNTAALWYAEHGYPLESIRHAQMAENWTAAARLLSDHWLGLYLDGRAGAAHELVARFPPGAVATDAEFAAVAAADELNHGSLEEAERYVALATRGTGSMRAERREHFQVILAVLRLSLARQRGDLPAVVEEAQQLLRQVETAEAAQLRFGRDLRALALISLGIAEIWAGQVEDGERHLEQGIALARRIERPYLEILGTVRFAVAPRLPSLTVAAERGREAIELARRHGWSDQPIAGIAYALVGGAMVGWGRLEEAEPWLARAERTLRPDIEPAVGIMVHGARGLLELVRGRDADALRAFRAIKLLTGLLMTPRRVALGWEALLLQTRVRLGDLEAVESGLAGLDKQDREAGETRIALAVLRLAQNDPQAATVALAPVLDGSAALTTMRSSLIAAFLLEAIARDALGDAVAVERALERALELAEVDGLVWPFLVHRAPQLLERQRRHRTAHAGLLSEIVDLLAGVKPAPRDEPADLRGPLTESETRVLRYLPTNLSQPEIAGELSLSVNTVNTHIGHLYAKLGAHRRGEAVEQARSLGLLAPSSRQR
jgi:LuxR family maltose regulon positive regulatory protein